MWKSWMNDEIKTLIKLKNWFYQRQKWSDNLDYEMLNVIMIDILNVVSSSKFKYHKCIAKEPKDPKTTVKT